MGAGGGEVRGNPVLRDRALSSSEQMPYCSELLKVPTGDSWVNGPYLDITHSLYKTKLVLYCFRRLQYRHTPRGP